MQSLAVFDDKIGNGLVAAVVEIDEGAVGAKGSAAALPA
jgi:hypothetical protein